MKILANKILAFDTANPICSVAIKVADSMFVEQNSVSKNKQSDIILFLIDGILKKSKFTLSDLMPLLLLLSRKFHWRTSGRKHRSSFSFCA